MVVTYNLNFPNSHILKSEDKQVKLILIYFIKNIILTVVDITN
jgi:hypothetical protein